MPASVVLSHVYEDLGARDTLRAWAVAGKLGPGVVVTGETEDVRQQGPSAIRSQLSPLLQGASAVIVLVGNATHNHAWVDYEVNHARSGRKKVVAVRIPQTTGALPKSLSGIDVVPMDPTAIRQALSN
ncbi:MAG: TIR domain-containing protein [Planctomycetes bacterium]|nr:TIR domain-containing protein [Planctomycetota bacterium]